MCRFSRLTLLAAALLIFLLGVTPASAQSGKDAKGAKDKWNVAIVIHEGVELLDFAGPGEVFQAAAGGRAFRVYTVADSTQPITSQRFVKIIPNHSITDCPKPDIIVIPGGNTGVLTRNAAMMKWLKAASAETEVMFSVCTGAFALADLGLLDGKEATTHWGSLKGLEKNHPRVKVRSDRRVVDNGSVVTAAGVSAGIDGALHLVARLCGLETAKKTARYMEYRWEPEPASTAPAGEKSSEARAREHWFAGELDQAVKAYQEVVKANPKDAVAFYRLGDSQFQLKNFKDARDSLEEALRLGIHGGNARATLGRIYFEFKENQKAAEQYQAALRLGTDDFFATYNLACALALSGQKDQALETLEKAFEAGTVNVGYALLDEDFVSIRQEKRFRDLFRRHAQSRPLKLVRPDEPGKPLAVSGVVKAPDGSPIAGALLEIYNADNDGHYTKEQGKLMGESVSRIFGYLRSGPDGRFEFETVYPGPYPLRKGVEGDAANIPRHIHINISAPGYKHRSLQVVFADDPRMTAHWHDWAKKGRNPVVTVTQTEGKAERCTVELQLDRQ